MLRNENKTILCDEMVYWVQIIAKNEKASFCAIVLEGVFDVKVNGQVYCLSISTSSTRAGMGERSSRIYLPFGIGGSDSDQK